jgi:hypothetical protein
LSGRAGVLEWERRWIRPAGFAALAGVALLIGSIVVITGVGGEGNAEILRNVDEQASSVTVSSLLEAAGFVLLVAPLVLLFRAAQARSDRVRGQLIGLVVAAPLFLAVSGILNGLATNDAASTFVAGEAKSTLTVKEAATECRDRRKEKGARDFGSEYEGSGGSALSRCTSTKVADDEATNALSEAGPQGFATGFALGGRLGIAVALVYTCLFAMRTGLLSRFWGSLGMALGVAALLLLVQFTLIFFIYLGLLLLGWVPGGRPPAWAAGEAIPWPTPGEKAAAALSEPDGGPGETAAGMPDREAGRALPDPGERRKRKQRD